MCSLTCTIPASWLKAASPTKQSKRARLAQTLMNLWLNTKYLFLWVTANLKKKQTLWHWTKPILCHRDKQMCSGQSLACEPGSDGVALKCGQEDALDWPCCELQEPSNHTSQNVLLWMIWFADWSTRQNSLEIRTSPINCSGLALFCPQLINRIQSLQACRLLSASTTGVKVATSSRHFPLPAWGNQRPQHRLPHPRPCHTMEMKS